MREFLTFEKRTPIEVALQIDENGMTTARKLYAFLELDPKNYSRWCKVNIIDNEFATEYEDYEVFFFNDENPLGGRPTTDYKLTAHFAKKLSMKGNGEKAEQAREYFTSVEEKVKQKAIDKSQLSTQMQMILNMAENMAKQELEQKRQAEQIQQIERKQEVITEVLSKASGEEEFKSWCKRQISRIVTIGEFNKGATLSEKFQLAWNESFERLMEKRPCNLKQRVANEKGRALVNGKTKSWIDKNINSLNVICADMNLRPVYESALREMAIYYCI